MVEEVLLALQIMSGELYVDCTTGEGGHSLAILQEVSPPPRVIGFDLDSNALEAATERLKGFGQFVELVHGNYANMIAAASERGETSASGVLMDLGGFASVLTRLRSPSARGAGKNYNKISDEHWYAPLCEPHCFCC